MNIVTVGKESKVTHVPPHPLMDDLHLALSHLVCDHRTTPQQLVDAMACIASIIDSMGPPMTVVENPYGEA